jgi:hypothetical protein
MSVPDKCSHGKTWVEECADCDAVSEDVTLLQHCACLARRAAAFYEKNPGYVQPATIIDLYRTVARIAELAGAASKQQEGE